MAAEIIRKNIHRILDNRNWTLSDLERKAGTNRNVYEIIRGRNNNPSAQIIKQIANTLNVNYQELLDDKNSTHYIQDYSMVVNAFNLVISELQTLPSTVQVTYDSVTCLIQESCSYATQSNISTIDPQFVKWLIKKYYSPSDK